MVKNLNRLLWLSLSSGAVLIATACQLKGDSTNINGQSPNEAETINRNLTVADIDPLIYFDKNDTMDPFHNFYETFRANRTADMQDPSKPGPVTAFPSVHISHEKPWNTLTNIIKLAPPDTPLASPEKVKQLSGAVKMRLALDHPDVKIVQLMVGPGGVLPTHAGGAPGIYIVIDGNGIITVENESHAVTPGTTVKINPYDVRRISAARSERLKIIWIRWAPAGDQRYLSAGYYLTGANQHVQPKTAVMPTDYQFWGQEYVLGEAKTNASNWLSLKDGSAVKAQANQLLGAREALGDTRNLYPNVPVFSHESQVGWLDKETLEKANFFWAKDVKKLGDLLIRWSEVFRYKGFFQASRPEGGWDFNISQTAWGPHSRYVEHSHSIPEFYYMLSGPVEHWIGDDKYVAMPGDIFVTNSYETHQSRGITDNIVFRNISSSWAPNGDRSVFERPFFVVEDLPEQPISADLGDSPKFH